MRNAYVVLVFSCVGLSSGFIVPSRIVKIVDQSQKLLVNNTGKALEELNKVSLDNDVEFIVLPSKTNKSKPNNLESNQNGIEDKELYEQNNGKENNVNERSFVYINQKFKTPVVNQIYSSADPLQDSFSSLINEERIFGRHPLAYISANKDYFTSKVFDKGPSRSIYFFEEMPFLNQHDNTVVVDRKKIQKIQEAIANSAITKVPDMQTEYVELLKPPIVRTPNIDIPKENMRWTHMKPNYFNNHQNIHKEVFQQYFAPDTAQKQLPAKHVISYDPENFGFPSPYGQRSTSNILNNKTEQSNIPNNKTKQNNNADTNNKIKKLLTENRDLSKLLDKFLKDSLENAVTEERLNANINCNYSECFTKTGKQLLDRNGIAVECKCGRRFNVKQRQSHRYELRSTTKKEEKPSTETALTSKSTEVNDYSELLNEDASFKVLIGK